MLPTPGARGRIRSSEDSKQRFNLELQVEDALKNAYRKPFKTRDGKFWIKKAKASAKRSLATKAKAKAASKNKSVDGKRSESKKQNWVSIYFLD